MDGHDEFERILRSRYTPQMRSNLPERIIAASLKEPTRKANAAVSWIVDFWDSFALPRPALAMAMVVALFIGVVVGVTTDSNAASGDGDFFLQSRVQADLGDML